jgi:hypothetical protein
MKRFRTTFLLLAFLVAAPTLLRAQIIKGEVFVGGNAAQVDGDECYRYRKFGVHAGAGALVPITNFMDVGLEVLFSQKGANKNDSLNLHLGSYTGTYNLKLNYVEVPLMIYLTDKNRFSVGIGFSYGRIVGISEKANGVSTGIGLGDGKLHWKENEDDLPDISKVKNITQLGDIVHSAGFADSISIPQVVANSHTYRPRDFGICADLRVRIWEGIHAELRYQYSIVPIRTRLFYKDQNETLLKDDDKNVPPLQLQYNNSLTLRVVYIFNERRSKSNKEMMGKN